MVVLSGFVSLVNALAWPSAILAIAVLFRRELRLAMGRLGEVKYGGMEVTFREDLRQAETLARAVPRANAADSSSSPSKIQLEIASDQASDLAGTLVGQETSPATTILSTSHSKPDPRSARTLDSFFRLCEESPREGVLETWGELSRVLIHASTVLGDRRTPAPLRVETALRFLVERGWLNSAEAELVERLRSLNNQVERREGSLPSRDDARRFVELAGSMIHRIISLG